MKTANENQLTIDKVSSSVLNYVIKLLWDAYNDAPREDIKRAIEYLDILTSTLHVEDSKQ